MDIEKNDAKFGSPILLTMVLLIIIPSSAGYIDCRISCRRCHENTEHAAVLEVYCAMCEECKQRRRERMLGKTKGKIKPTAGKQQVRMRVGAEVNPDNEALILRPQESFQQEQDSQLQYQGQPQQQYEPQQQFEQQPVYQPQQPLQLRQPPQPPQPPQEPPEPQQPQPTYKPQKALRGYVYPPGCPTPPICSDTEDEPDDPTETYLHDKETDPPKTTTTTTTTTTTQAPCPPIRHCRKKKHTHPPYPQPPCMNPCMVPPPMCPCPIFPPQGPPIWPVKFPPQSDPYKQQLFGTEDPVNRNEDYHYVFIGLPKKDT